LLEPNQKGAYDYAWYVPAFDALIVDYVNSGVEVIVMMGENPCRASGDIFSVLLVASKIMLTRLILS